MALHQSQDPSSRASRESFDAEARDYNAIRPGYPEALIDDIIALSKLPEDGSILEVGCGTAQATLPFAKRGYPITALDLGPRMVAIASAKLEPYPKVRVYQSAFEDFEAEAESFNLLMAATAWHWVRPEVGYAKAAHLLKPTGSLAIFSNPHPKPYTGFFKSAQPLYDDVFGPRGADSSTEEDIAVAAKAISSSGYFPKVEVRTYPWARIYTTKEYLQLLNTYSDRLALEPDKRTWLFEKIGEHIEQDYGGAIEKPYLSVLLVAKTS